MVGWFFNQKQGLIFIILLQFRCDNSIIWFVEPKIRFNFYNPFAVLLRQLYNLTAVAKTELRI